MTEPIVNRRRIDKLRAIAFEYGLTNEDAKDFGKLSKTATWEALLEVNRIHYVNNDAVDTGIQTVYIPLDNALDNKSESLDTVDSWTATNFLEWVDLSQLIAIALASAGVFVLAMSMWRQINPLNLFPSPVRINIQIGTKL
ncbi:hypothetical protein QT972_25205, partial [Microcoleus sp. herbarium7]|uniref:hypothetical protein n=1 Tax=Microcoleus sp. herbarium7 TaxID=3055435 RepID=UPI002FD190A9